MCQTLFAALRRAGYLFTVGWMTAALILLATPAWSLADQDSEANAGQTILRDREQTDDTIRAAPRYRTESSQEQQALDQKPQLSDDVKLRVETYTGNDY